MAERSNPQVPYCGAVWPIGAVARKSKLTQSAPREK